VRLSASDSKATNRPLAATTGTNELASCVVGPRPVGRLTRVVVPASTSRTNRYSSAALPTPGRVSSCDWNVMSRPSAEIDGAAPEAGVPSRPSSRVTRIVAPVSVSRRNTSAIVSSSTVERLSEFESNAT
jgi:hypothetical protein